MLDLAQQPLPHLDAFTIRAFTPPEARDEAQRNAIRTSERLVDQLFACDTLVISSPMWNLGLPSVLKAGSTILPAPAAPSPLRPKAPKSGW